MMTKEQIQNRLEALDMYEQSVRLTMPDEGDYTTRELMRIVTARSKLREMLKAAE